MKNYGNFDSKFRFVIVASKRAKELLKGAKPRIKAKAKNSIRIAQSEVRMGLIEYDVVRARREEARDQEERVLLAEDIEAELEEESEKGVLAEEEAEREEDEEEIEMEEEEELEEGEEEEAEEEEERD